MLAVLRSGQLSLGPLLGEFERTFAARLGAGYGVAVSSGTAGLHLALRAVGVSDGDEVITSPFSFVASANVALYERARPVFADIDPVTLCVDPAAVAAAVTPRTAARAARARLRLPRRHDGAGATGTADRGGRVRGAGRHLRRRRGRGRPPPPGGVRLLRQQAAHHRRGRRRHHLRGVDQGAPGLRAQSGPCAGHGMAGPRPPGLQLPPVRARLCAGPGPARAPGRHAGRAGAGCRALPRGPGGDRGSDAAVPRRRWQPTRLVCLRRPAPARG